MIKDDEYLERIVAGIQSVTSKTADVKWNDVINGRQFDVSVRFRLGTLDYLVLVEVKNRKRKASAEDVEAFVTKTRDKNASKAVFVTRAGFQSGAIDVARRHGIDLFTIEFDHSRPALSTNSTFIECKNGKLTQVHPPQVTLGAPEPAINFAALLLVYCNGKRLGMPTERTQLQYYVEHTRLADGRTIDEVIKDTDVGKLCEGEARKIRIDIDPHQEVCPPDEYFFPSGLIKAIECAVIGVKAIAMSQDRSVDASALSAPVIYKNALTGDFSEFRIETLPIGERRVVPGKFYFNEYPLRYYFCESITDEIARWYVVESFQIGLLQMFTFTQHVRYSFHYLPVTDKKILKRLKGRLADYERLRSEHLS